MVVVVVEDFFGGSGGGGVDGNIKKKGKRIFSSG